VTDQYEASDDAKCCRCWSPRGVRMRDISVRCRATILFNKVMTFFAAATFYTERSTAGTYLILTVVNT